jgi:VWFA-related protein
MTRLLLVAAVIASLGPAGGRRQATAERSGPRVAVDFVAFDRHGAQVLDLKPEEVEVWIGHFRVPIDTFSVITPTTSETDGRLIVLLLDDVTVPMPGIARVKDAAKRFVTRMTPGDRMAIVTLDGAEMQSSDDPSRLLRAIDAYSVRGGVMTIDRLGEHVLKTIATLSRQLTEAPGRRKTIVGIGSGWVFDRPIPVPTIGPDLRPEWIDAMRALAFAHANLYAIDPSGVGAGRADTGTIGFAHATGGHAFVNTNDINGAVDQIMRECANYYVVAVADPPVGRGADLRELEVRVLRRGVTARARQAIPGGS